MGNSIAVLHPAHCGPLDLTMSVMFILQDGETQDIGCDASPPAGHHLEECPGRVCLGDV